MDGPDYSGLPRVRRDRGDGTYVEHPRELERMATDLTWVVGQMGISAEEAAESLRVFAALFAE